MTRVTHALVDAKALARAARHLHLERYNVSNAFSMAVGGALPAQPSVDRSILPQLPAKTHGRAACPHI